MKRNAITVEATINAPVEKVWEYWNEPKHIMAWCHASDDWHAPYADNDLRTGGKFKTTMAEKMEVSVSILEESIHQLKRMN